jgi:opacity protein-like surface antigen
VGSNSGWLVVGAGIDAANGSAKVEYNFPGLDDRTFMAPAGFRSLAGVRNRDIQTVKLGVNYRFNWGSYQYRLVFPPVVCCARAECNAR